VPEAGVRLGFGPTTNGKKMLISTKTWESKKLQDTGTAKKEYQLFQSGQLLIGAEKVLKRRRVFAFFIKGRKEVQRQFLLKKKVEKAVELSSFAGEFHERGGVKSSAETLQDSKGKGKKNV